jgi:integrase
VLPVELLPILRRHREAQDLARMVAGEDWEDHDLVFCQPNGRPIDPRDDWEDWKELLRVAGVRDARVHDGRHTAGTLLIAGLDQPPSDLRARVGGVTASQAKDHERTVKPWMGAGWEMGVHVRTVQEILGHADVRTTQRYTFVASPMVRDAAQQMGRVLWGDEGRNRRP